MPSSTPLERGPRIPAFWCRIPSRPNFGDALTPWLIRRLSGREPEFVELSQDRIKYLVTGSIAGQARRHCTIWGVGIMNRTDVVSPDAEILAVRGPLTRDRVANRACKPPPIGDPALLLPRLYQPAERSSARVGVALHFSQAPRLSRRLPATAELKLIDMQAPVERVIDDIAGCAAVAASSLHAIIASHAYGIPALWLQFGPLPSGDDSKFEDYLKSVGLAATAVAQPPEALRPDDILREASRPAFLPDLDRLWSCCPFRRQR